jgi:hypothetical protein
VAARSGEVVEPVRQELETLESVLAQHGESRAAETIRHALAGNESSLHAFLVSNELWGGSGSIADQAGSDQSRDTRRPIEAALLALGLEQIRRGLVNARTRMWVDAFQQWHRAGI